MRLLANYSKKVGEENYSNSSYSVTVETTSEVTAEKISETIDYLFLEAKEGVNRQIESAKANHQTNGKNGLNNGGNGKSKHSEDFSNSNNSNNRLPQENSSNLNSGNNNRFENQKPSNTNGNNNGGGNGNGGNGSNGNGNGHITEKQVSILFGLLAKAGIKDRSGYLHDEFGIDSDVKNLSKKQGSRIIDHLLKVTNGAGV